ncbi:MAG: glycosyltransferase family 2 protein [Candidatus Levybacteria bacterium]|nr:glycosyltransferase family 2 protein [Candidatus Levybacteria bacterium]
MRKKRINNQKKVSLQQSGQPFFSVIIPTLNEEKYLPRLLHALSKQTFTSLEVIVVDASSKDHTIAEAEKFHTKIQKLTSFQIKKRTIAYQRNFGAEKAKGVYLVFLDADVDLSPGYLQKIYTAIKKGRYDFITTWGQADTKRKIDVSLVMIYNLIIEIEKAIEKPFSPGFNTIIRSDHFRRIKFWENLSFSEDYDFTARAIREGINLKILREPRIVISLRRFRSEGTFSTITRFVIANIYIMLKGPITTDLFEYSMGGHVHNKKSEEMYKKKLSLYLRSIQKAHKSVYDRLRKWD